MILSQVYVSIFGLKNYADDSSMTKCNRFGLRICQALDVLLPITAVVLGILATQFQVELPWSEGISYTMLGSGAALLIATVLFQIAPRSLDWCRRSISLNQVHHEELEFFPVYSGPPWGTC